MKTIYLTVDIECHDRENANLYIDGFDGKQQWGLKKILELAKKYDIPVNCFLDVGEAKEYGHEFISNIVKLIRSYGQPVFFHLHPDYLSGDHSRTFLWQYSRDEKERIFEEAASIYDSFTGKQDVLIFRAGRYGVDPEFYDILRNDGRRVLDLSYVYDSFKMCRLTEADTGVRNKAACYKSVTILPNTRFIAFRLFGKRKPIGLDTSDATLNEYKRFLRKTQLSSVVLTMHSWNFIRKWFFLPGFFVGDKAMVAKFSKCVQFAKDNGFGFGNLLDYRQTDDRDELIDLCTGVGGRFLCVVNNFFRFHKIARLNAKYFIIYTVFYLLLISAFLLIVL